jgi:hypothetical protein
MKTRQNMPILPVQPTSEQHFLIYISIYKNVLWCWKNWSTVMVKEANLKTLMV